MRELLLSKKGEDKVYFKVSSNGENKIIETGFRVDNSKDLCDLIEENFSDFARVVKS